MDAQTPYDAPPQSVRLEAEAWKRAGLGKSRAYALIANGEFPRPVKLGRSSRFVASEVDAWIAARIAERDASQSA